ncbi:MAG: DUF2281 domain-containing protein [Gammaproteobacteria bacterium]|nr:DUF2281 domain-containing protein [Gammaproteobacteria bacterium]NNJ84595.1 hypothetical protein [Gammaproteobacteria bacterium]
MTPDARRLIRFFSDLPDEDKKTLLAFAEFLANRSEAVERNRPSPVPIPIPRPETETVIGAIRRLASTYPMLNKAEMLNETSSLMGEHVLHGQSAPEIIDKLEAAFERHYRDFSSKADDDRDEGQAVTTETPS